jgi:hypothetical protein
MLYQEMGDPEKDEENLRAIPPLPRPQHQAAAHRAAGANDRGQAIADFLDQHLRRKRRALFLAGRGLRGGLRRR